MEIGEELRCTTEPPTTLKVRHELLRLNMVQQALVLLDVSNSSSMFDHGVFVVVYQAVV